MRILVTGAEGFVGKSVVTTLENIMLGKDKTKLLRIEEIYKFDKDNSYDELEEYVKHCDFIINLAGINRPENIKEFYEGNADFSLKLCNLLKKHKNQAPIINSSSIQAEKDNDYGKSKKQGEDYLLEIGKENGNPIYIYRFANLFGKWCRPNYNSVVATWCFNVANHLELQINNAEAELTLCYIDDVVEEFLNCINGHPFITGGNYYGVEKTYQCKLGDLAQIIQSFAESRNDLNVINQGDELIKKLYATYLSYLPKDEFCYPLKMNIDERGSFTEFLKTKEYGQVSINISKPGITKGEHWHHTKNEKFLVVSGIGKIQFRKIGEDEVIEYKVSGEKLEVIDIPTGYTHNIINVGELDMVTIMWANEVFNPNKPDTYFERVIIENE